jgi:hypothetical protein
MTEIKSCSRCSLGFFPVHGNQRLCPTCRAKSRRRGWRPNASYGTRRCDLCGIEYTASVASHRFCRTCAKRADKLRAQKYATPTHRGLRQAARPLVATGQVRCARGSECKWAEWVDGERIGGFIRPGQAWDLGHPDGESPGGPEHAACNRAAPSRMRGGR